MQIKISGDINAIAKQLETIVDNVAKDTLNKVVDYASKQAQDGYDKFYDEVPADDPFVFVRATPLVPSARHVYSREIKCTGNQVLFIEFGAGAYFYRKTGEIETRLYQGVMPNIEPRPSGILDIGEYGQGRGKDDLWFYKSQTGRESENAHLIKYNANGDPIMITHGNRPARALYRAVGMAMRRLIGGKLK